MSWSRSLVRLACLLVVPASTLPAQEGGGQRRRGGGDAGAAGNTEPSNWASLNTGFLLLAQVSDGASQAVWDFGQGFPISLSYERTIAPGITAGLKGSYARMPLVYRGTASNGGCTACDAHATIATYGATFHSGRTRSGTAIYQVFHVFLGAIQYGAFEQDTPRTALPPDGSNLDFLFSAGYGFGYAMAPDWRLELIGESMNSIHERDNLPGNAQTLARHFHLGLGLRVGF